MKCARHPPTYSCTKVADGKIKTHNVSYAFAFVPSNNKLAAAVSITIAAINATLPTASSAVECLR